MGASFDGISIFGEFGVDVDLRWLYQVVAAAGGKIPVFLDGGVRRGTDVLKALALGAAGVFVSRLSYC